MRAVKPLYPEGMVARAVVFAKDQPEYHQLPALIEPDGTVHTRWELTPEERLAILDGACITLRLLTFNQPLQPLLLRVEGTDGLIELALPVEAQ